MYPRIHEYMNARPNNNQLITLYERVSYLPRIQQYPVDNTYNIVTSFSSFIMQALFHYCLLFCCLTNYFNTPEHFNCLFPLFIGCVLKMLFNFLISYIQFTTHTHTQKYQHMEKISGLQDT